MQKDNEQGRVVYIVDGCRTPFLKARGKTGPFTGADLGFMAARALLARMPFAPSELGEVVTGCVMPTASEANISRIIALRLGCGEKVPAYTVQRNCASGLQAIDTAYQDILLGHHDLVLAGGTEAMSHAPLLFKKSMVDWLAAWTTAKTFSQRLRVLPQFRLHYLAPIISLIQGLSDPLLGISMGQTAENLAYRFKISREEMDSFAVRSHLRAAKLQQEKGLTSEITTLYDSRGSFYAEDDGIRADSSVEKLSTLKPFFDKKFGMVTAGNSSQVTDGAAFLILASADAVKKYKLPVLGRIVATQWAGVNPAEMGLGPANAIAPLLKSQHLSLSDIDYWEINEAFSGQVIACLRALDDKSYCKEQFGLNEAVGKIDEERLNVDGGAIALGHPVGASGARIVLHLLNVLKREHAKRGIASLCIGGGQGGAMLIENSAGSK